MEKDLISVITPTYNRGKEIKKTIYSILNQKYHNLELIIIDDGSTDNTKEIIKSIHDKRIKIIEQVHIGIPAVGRNNGLRVAKGEYIAFIDHDDLWFPCKLHKQIRMLKKNPDLLVIATNGIIFPYQPERKLLWLRKNKKISFKELTNENIIINSSTLIRKEIFNKIGLLDDSIGNYLPDYDFWLRLLRYKDNSILILKDILVVYRIHKSNITRDMNYRISFLKEAYKRLLYIYNKHLNYDQSLPDTPLLRMYQYRLQEAKIRRNLFRGEINIFQFLNNKKLTFSSKLKLIKDFYLRRWFFIRNTPINKIETFIKFIAFQIFRLELKIKNFFNT